MIWASYSRGHRSSYAWPVGGPSKGRPRHQRTHPGDDPKKARHVGEEVRELLFRPEPVATPSRARGHALGGGIELRLAPGRLADGRIEENEPRVPFGEREQGNQRRYGVKHPDRRLRSISGFDGFEDPIVVMDQRRHVVLLLEPDGIPTVVPEVVDHQVEVVREERPERVVEIDGEPVSVAEDEPGAGGVSVPANGNDGLVVETDLAHRERFGDLPDGLRGHAVAPESLARPHAGHPDAGTPAAGRRYARARPEIRGQGRVSA